MSVDCATSITAAIRIRPFLTRELESGDAVSIIEVPEKGIVRLLPKNALDSCCRKFAFDHTFYSLNNSMASTETPYADQATVYRAIGSPLLLRALEGYNACLLAYGMTASGKTYSLTGPTEDPGIIPRLSEDLFVQILARQSKDTNYSIELSYFEIYNEKIRDLLNPTKPDTGSLTVRENAVTGPYVEGLSHIEVRSSADILGWLRTGNRQRTVASTKYNDQSSRSHCVFTLHIKRHTLASYCFGDVIESVYSSQINIVDLAGSERQVSNRSVEDRFNESCQINKSLFTLGKVISELARNSFNALPEGISVTEPWHPNKTPSTELRSGRRVNNNTPAWRTPNPKRAGYVSYRDSVLTWLLRNSLGGNSMTTILATVSPSAMHYDETLSTLRYAKKAQSIVNTAIVNEDPQGRTIRQLVAEVARLRQASAIHPEPGSPHAFEVARLRELLVLREQEVCELSRKLTERTLQHGKPYHSPLMKSPLTGEVYATPHTVSRSTSPVERPTLVPRLDTVDDTTPVKQLSVRTLEVATSPLIQKKQDASTATSERWGCNQERYEELCREIMQLQSQLRLTSSAHEYTKRALAEAQLRIDQYQAQQKTFLCHLHDLMTTVLKNGRGGSVNVRPDS